VDPAAGDEAGELSRARVAKIGCLRSIAAVRHRQFRVDFDRSRSPANPTPLNSASSAGMAGPERTIGR